MSDALLADLRALAEKWKRPGLTCEPWDDVSDELRDLIAKHTPEPDVSERDELARVLHQGTCEGRLFAHNASVTRCERAAEAILTAGWRRR